MEINAMCPLFQTERTSPFCARKCFCQGGGAGCPPDPLLPLRSPIKTELDEFGPHFIPCPSHQGMGYSGISSMNELYFMGKDLNAFLKGAGGQWGGFLAEGKARVFSVELRWRLRAPLERIPSGSEHGFLTWIVVDAGPPTLTLRT